MGANVPMGPGGPMPGNAGMGPRPVTPNTMEQQQKLLQQQQMLRAQAAMQQHMIRPPPPDYKTSAGMMQGMQPRFASGPPPSIRRMPHQNIPPSGMSFYNVLVKKIMEFVDEDLRVRFI